MSASAYVPLIQTLQLPMEFDPVALIARKRDGQQLASGEIKRLIDAYTTGALPDYQMSAFLMAAFLNGLDAAETQALTHAMLYSGAVIDLSAIPGTKVDKHSTGGVGDKVSLILAPVVAACGVPVPMISGRGLRHSGGTLDKLESIPGFNVQLDIAAYKAQLEKLGLVMIGQTAEIAPADRKMYALRDVTATVANRSFIAPSIMSKKIAAGIDGLVLDVKFGAGAFMKTPADARPLAELLVQIGEEFGKPTVAWLTNMDQPLGYAVGNWPEMAESIACLRGEWIEDLMQLTLTLAGEMICLGKKANSPEEGYTKAKEAIASGAALEKFLAMVDAQGGDTNVVERGTRPHPAHVITVPAPVGMDGYIHTIDALAIGEVALALGAGRLKKEDAVDPLAGLTLAAKQGEQVAEGEPLATLFSNGEVDKKRLIENVQTAFTVGAEARASLPLLYERYTMNGWSGR